MNLNRFIKITINNVDYSVRSNTITQADDTLITQNDDILTAEEHISNATITNYGENPYFGIASGTLNLNEILCENEFELGNLCSDKFEVEIFNGNYDVSGKPITVSCINTGVTPNTETVLFTGIIDSSERTDYENNRKIVAYDKAYYIKETNVASWWTNYWASCVTYIAVVNPEGNPATLGYYELISGAYQLTTDTTVVSGKTYYRKTATSTLKALRESLCTYMNLNNPNVTLPNDSMTFEQYNEFTDITFGDLIRMICEAQGCIPHIDRTGNLQYIIPDVSNVCPIDEYYAKNTSSFEDYNTKPITGINIYNGSGNFTYNFGSTTNAYIITSNIFLMSLSQLELENACNNIFNMIKGINYIPCTLNMIVSDLTFNLGKRLDTDFGTHYIWNQTYSGSLFVDQEIECKANGEYLDKTAVDRNKDIIEGKRWSSIVQTVDNITTTVSNVSRNLEGQIQDVSSSINQTATNVTTQILNDTKILTSFDISATGVTISAEDINTKLQLDATGVTITDESDNKLAKFETEGMTIRNWAYLESRGGNALNIFKRRIN